MEDSLENIEGGKSSEFATQLRRLIPYIMAVTGVVFILAGILVNYFKTQQNITTSTTSIEQIASVAGETKIKTIVVDISGAVERPGVYSIPYDSRIDNVLITAGGLAPKADRKYISRYINLAQRAIDGMKIYIPFENDGFINQAGQLAGGVVNVGGLVNINVASVSELDALPGIGSVTANKIIADRPYQSLSELVSRGIISRSVFEKIKDKIAVN